jgi:signal transduction histidine kinase
LTDTLSTELEGLASHLAAQRQAILDTWRAAARNDPEQPTASSLTRSQFNDHIPTVLDAFERKLRSTVGSRGAAAADRDMEREQVKHGLERWQQGYRLQELMREWGHLHVCLLNEIERFASFAPGMTLPAMARAHQELAQLINEGISDSTDQYARMERSEAAGHVRDLERSLETLKDLERHRLARIHEAVHDLRGNVQSVTSAADVLRSPGIPEPERVEYAALLQEGVKAVATMLGELMELARLEAGQEVREIAPFDAAELLRELCRSGEPMAVQKKLHIKTEGPRSLPVEGDAGMVRRLLQNLVFNALRYTEQGGVTISWGEEKTNWWVIVKDTGPGLLGGPGAPLAVSLKEATVVAYESDQKGRKGKPSHVLNQADTKPAPPSQLNQRSGEGIGLSIVKRLCELLDASLELISSSASGTSFRIVIPKQYAKPTAAGAT